MAGWQFTYTEEGLKDADSHAVIKELIAATMERYQVCTTSRSVNDETSNLTSKILTEVYYHPDGLEAVEEWDPLREYKPGEMCWFLYPHRGVVPPNPATVTTLAPGTYTDTRREYQWGTEGRSNTPGSIYYYSGDTVWFAHPGFPWEEPVENPEPKLYLYNYNTNPLAQLTSPPEWADDTPYSTYWDWPSHQVTVRSSNIYHMVEITPEWAEKHLTSPLLFRTYDHAGVERTEVSYPTFGDLEWAPAKAGELVKIGTVWHCKGYASATSDGFMAPNIGFDPVINYVDTTKDFRWEEYWRYWNIKSFSGNRQGFLGGNITPLMAIRNCLRIITNIYYYFFDLNDYDKDYPFNYIGYPNNTPKQWTRAALEAYIDMSIPTLGDYQMAAKRLHSAIPDIILLHRMLDACRVLMYPIDAVQCPDGETLTKDYNAGFNNGGKWEPYAGWLPSYAAMAADFEASWASEKQARNYWVSGTPVINSGAYSQNIRTYSGEFAHVPPWTRISRQRDGGPSLYRFRVNGARPGIKGKFTLIASKSSTDPAAPHDYRWEKLHEKVETLDNITWNWWRRQRPHDIGDPAWIGNGFDANYDPNIHAWFDLRGVEYFKLLDIPPTLGGNHSIDIGVLAIAIDYGIEGGFSHYTDPPE